MRQLCGALFIYFLLFYFIGLNIIEWTNVTCKLPRNMFSLVIGVAPVSFVIRRIEISEICTHVV